VPPRGLLAGVMNYLRPWDDQGMGYIHTTTTTIRHDTVVPDWPFQRGARDCQQCHTISKECFPCLGPCQGRVYYCSESCQETDSKQHKKWCGLTRDQLHQELVKEGRREQGSKGEWRTLL
jgi:hypothetical protein